MRRALTVDSTMLSELAVLISDESAMDPDMAVWMERPPPCFMPECVFRCLQSLWLGVPQSCALAVFLMVGGTIVLLGPFPCIVGIVVAGILAAIRGSISHKHKSSGGCWMTVLQHSAAVAALAHGLGQTLLCMDHSRLSLWLTSRLPGYCGIFSAGVVLCVMTLFMLGLERSKMLRLLLMALLPTALVFQLLGLGGFYNVDLLPQLYNSTFDPGDVLQSTAYFSLAFSGTMERLPLSRPLGLGYRSTGVWLVNIFRYNNVSVLGLKMEDIYLVSGGLVLVSTLCLSLSLVEVMSLAQRSVVSVAGTLLPARAARENSWTNTPVTAIAIAGVLSGLLASVGGVASLAIISSAAYLLSQCCDLINAVYVNYKPTFLPKHTEEELKDGGGYELLANPAGTVGSVDEAGLSDESSLSSDTDIDEVVHEFKATVEMIWHGATSAAAPEPTVYTARRVCVCLAAVVFISVLTSLGILAEMFYLPILTLLEVVFFVYLIHRSPRHGESLLWLWQQCALLLVYVVLATSLLVAVLPVPFLWILLGVALWGWKKWKQWRAMQARIARAKMHRTPSQMQSVLSCPPSYHQTWERYLQKPTY